MSSNEKSFEEYREEYLNERNSEELRTKYLNYDKLNEFTNYSESEELKARINALTSEVYAQRLLIDGKKIIDHMNDPYEKQQNTNNSDLHRRQMKMSLNNQRNRYNPYKRSEPVYEGPHKRNYATVNRKIDEFERHFDREIQEVLSKNRICYRDICPFGTHCFNKGNKCKKLHRVSIYRVWHLCFHGKICKITNCEYKHNW